MLRYRKPLIRAAWLLYALAFQKTFSQPVIDFSPVVAGLTNPVDIIPEPGSSRLFIVEQGGSIRIVDGTTLLPTPFLTISSGITTGGERGLLSMAFHPQYLSNRYFFVYYTNGAGDITIGRYQRDAVNPNIADPSTRDTLLMIPKNFSNHNGGKLNFGPDGKLYFGTGDGGSGDDPDGNAQSNTSLLGKMLRLDVDDFATPPFYSIPTDNPFFGDPGNEEIFATGLRNPWKWSFDRSNGDIWIADVGQGAREEVNHVDFITAATGLNYGWRCREGKIANPNVTCTPTGEGTLTGPIFDYGHNNATGGFAIVGGYVYRGINPVNAPLTGYYICADNVSGNFWIVRPDGTFRMQDDLPGSISSFGQDNNGELWAVSLTGSLYSLFVASVLPLKLVKFTGESFNGYNELSWATAFEENTKKFIVEYALSGNDFSTAGEVAATSNSSGSNYSFKHYTPNTGIIKYRLNMVDIDQKSSYSPIITIGNRNNKETRIYPTTVTNQTLQIIAGFDAEKINIFSTDGKEVYAKALNGANGYFTISLPVLHKGMYIVKLIGNGNQKVEKIFIQ